MTSFFSRKIFRVLLLLLVIVAVIISAKMFTNRKNESSEDAHYLTSFSHSYKIMGNALPKDLNFCGEAIPIADSLLLQKMEKEFEYRTRSEYHLTILVKRARSFFKVVEPILKQYGIPEDFKYVPLVESNFYDTMSWAGAKGPWQLMIPIAQTFGLTVNDTLDERSDLKKSTEVICKCLLQTQPELKSWILALASLNYGSEGLQKRLKKINSPSIIVDKDFTTYLLRVVFYKEIFTRPGLYLNKKEK